MFYSKFRRKLAYCAAVTPLKTNKMEANYNNSCLLEPTDIEPNLVTSLIKDEISEPPGGWHVPTLDIDMPCELIPSQTPGHYHLYIDKKLTWKEYCRLMEVLVEVGIIEDGFYRASLHKGYSSLRLPMAYDEFITSQVNDAKGILQSI